MSDLDNLSQRVGDALKASGDVLATAESCTGGWIAETVTRRAGSSAWFDRAYVTYSNDAKREMAKGALRGAATMAVAVSGVAGPDGGTESKPVGMVCLAWLTRGGEAQAVTRHYPGDRAAVRRQAAMDALDGVIVLAGGGGKGKIA
jgi:nicotinamide-nucleotide amidase